MTDLAAAFAAVTLNACLLVGAWHIAEWIVDFSIGFVVGLRDAYRAKRERLR